ncbi:MAG: RQC-minor-1 family DNA-binding protein [Pseudomonadota bacterium]
MSRKVKRIPVTLYPINVGQVPEKEIRLILRGADDLIMSGGRTLLAKLLKGSCEKKILELNLNNSPVYGTFRNHRLQEITARIDWLIINNYLAIEYDYRLPLLVYTKRGWAIEREVYAAELMERINEWLTDPMTTPDICWLNDKNPEVLILLLDRIAGSGDPKYLPILESWASGTTRKLARRIQEVVGMLQHK